MRAHRLIVGCAAAGLLGTASAGCGTAGPAATETLDVAVTHARTVDSSASLPDRVAVRQPALIDTNASPYDLPVWPGPGLANMPGANPPAHVVGELAGQQARDLYAAAQENPGEWWDLGGVVVWLVVEPVR